MAFNLLLKSQLQRLVGTILPQIYTYGTCSTAKNEVAKVVVLTGFLLKKGARINVRFSDTTTSVPTSGNISLDVNNTGSKTVYISETNSICDYSYASSFCNNKVHQFFYDGNYWVWINDNNEVDALITSSEFEDFS